MKTIFIHKSVSPENLIFLKVISFFSAEQYVLKAEASLAKEILKINKCKFIPFGKIINSFNHFDFPEQKYCASYAKPFFPESLLRKYLPRFGPMKKFDEKIRAAFLADGASYFHENASLSIFLKTQKDTKKILFSTYLPQWKLS